MKPTKRRWLRLAIAPGLAALAMIGFASQAQAADYVGNCAGVPASVTGNATIGTAGAACTIPAAGVNATGNITVAGSTISTTGNLTAGNSLTLNASSNVNIKAVNATGAVNLTTTAGTIKTTTLTAGSQQTIQVNGIGNVTTGAISAGSSFKAVSTMGTVFLNGTVTTNTGGGGGNVLIRAGLNVRAGAISTSGGAKTGGVQIDANLLGGSTLFTIGSSATNGVASINTSNTSGGGFAGDFIMGGIQITNGDANSAGGITVTAMNKINVVASASRSGVLNLNAQNGTLTLPTGVLSSDGTSGAGQIALLANTLTTVNGTQISASQPSTAPNTIHGVVIAANTINVAGLSGLTVKGDGNGYVTAGAYVTILPKGAVTLSSNNNFISYLWTMSSFNLGTNAAVTVAGASAPITLQANGDNSQVTVSGYPIAFNNGAVNLTAKGSLFGGHNIVVQYTGTFSGTNGLTFGGNGAVTFNTSGITGNDSAGHITVLVDQSSINSTVPSVTMTANGVGTGNGGTINYQPTKVVTLASPIVNISANGQFGYVNFNPRANSTTWGDLSITSTTFNLNANGPTTGNGNAGTIFFASANSTFAASTKMKFSAIGPTSGSGNGGNITVFPGNVAGGTFKLGTNAGNLQVLANAGSTGGDGGLINVNPFPGSISIETANAVSATASSGAAANSKGGNVTLIGNPNVTVVPTVVGASINVDGKGTSDGGKIKIWGNGTLNLGNAAGSLALSAKAAGTGNGGTIEVQYVTQLTISDLQVQAGNGVGSNGNGGTVNIQNIGSLTVGSSNISAMGQGDGNGGHVTLNATLPVNIVTLSVNASAGSSGQGAGGFATVSSATGNTGVPLRPNTIFNVNAGTSTLERQRP